MLYNIKLVDQLVNKSANQYVLRLKWRLKAYLEKEKVLETAVAVFIVEVSEPSW